MGMDLDLDFPIKQFHRKEKKVENKKEQKRPKQAKTRGRWEIPSSLKRFCWIFKGDLKCT